MNCCYTDEERDSCPNRRMDELPMCDKHMRRTFRDALVLGVLPSDVFKVICQDAVELLGIGMKFREISMDAALAHARRQREAEEAARVAQQRGQVYYVRLTGNRIKIGFSIDLPQRLRNYRSRPEDVLATEPGTMELERQRHREFADERIDRAREDFWASERLMAHIERLAASVA